MPIVLHTNEHQGQGRWIPLIKVFIAGLRNALGVIPRFASEGFEKEILDHSKPLHYLLTQSVSPSQIGAGQRI